MDSKFIKGLKLNQGFYQDIIKPLIDSNYPDLDYSAGLIGYGSDVLGFDTHISMDHNWGPRLIVFLSDNKLEINKEKLDNLFKKQLPYKYKGFPTNFTDPKEDGVQSMEKINEGEINHLIEITGVKEYLNRYLSVENIENINLIDWLKFSDQSLIELTAGEIFHDGLGQLQSIREYLKFYPDDVLRLKLAALWYYISQEEAFIGRNLDIGEEMGVKLISSRIVNALIKICFYCERKYIPYSKWFTRSFKKLDCYQEIGDLFYEILEFEDLSKTGKKLCQAYKKVVSIQNKLELTEDIEVKVVDYYGRPYKVVFTEKIKDKLIESIKDKNLKKVNLDYVSLIQNSNGIDLTNNQKLFNELF